VVVLPLRACADSRLMQLNTRVVSRSAQRATADDALAATASRQIRARHTPVPVVSTEVAASKYMINAAMCEGRWMDARAHHVTPVDRPAKTRTAG